MATDRWDPAVSGTAEDVTSFRVSWNKQRSIWVFTVWFTGNHRIRKTGGKTKREAEQALVRYLAALPRDRSDRARRTDLEKLLHGYLGTLEVAESTMRNYRSAFARFLAWAGSTAPAEIRRPEADGYIKSLREDGLTSGSIRALVSPLRGAWNYAIHIDDGALEPTYGVPMNPWTELARLGVKPTRRRTQHLTEPQANRVIAAAAAESPMQGALVGTLVLAGLRSGELRALEWSAVDLEAGAHGTIHVIGGKGGKDRTVPMSKQLRELFDRYREHRRRYSLSMARGVFCKVHRRVGRTGLANYWKAALERAGVGDMPIHCARHTAASLWVRSGVDLRTVQAWLGHSSLSMVSVYAHMAPDQDAQVEKLDAYLGRLPRRSPDLTR